jgi:prepilin-type N-terminal cleavage/methylation domain-containing protein
LSRKAFTIIELLVVIAIIGIVAGLSIPAVQSARESSRRTYCSSQLGQIAKGIIQYETQHRHFPSGGWGKDWIGSAGPTGRAQSGGWIYAILPFLEQKNLYNSVAASASATDYGKL